MLAIYQGLQRLASAEFDDVVASTSYVGGTTSSPNKLRLALIDGSFLDIWLSADGDYSYHWERRRQAGTMYRWDNAPHYPSLATFPAHFHDGDEMTVLESHLPPEPERALYDILAFARQLLSG